MKTFCDYMERRKNILRHIEDIESRHPESECAESVRLLRDRLKSIPEPACFKLFVGDLNPDIWEK